MDELPALLRIDKEGIAVITVRTDGDTVSLTLHGNHGDYDVHLTRFEYARLGAAISQSLLYM